MTMVPGRNLQENFEWVLVESPCAHKLVMPRPAVAITRRVLHQLKSSLPSQCTSE